MELPMGQYRAKLPKGRKCNDYLAREYMPSGVEAEANLGKT